MLNNPQCVQHGAANRCAMCGGQFGLFRRYSWRTALCSKKCADRFKVRRENHHKWLHLFEPSETASKDMLEGLSSGSGYRKRECR